MRLYERFGERGYHTSIATTFGIDFDAYENIVLPRLRGAGCHNNVLMTDGAMLTQALAGASALPVHAGRLYTVSGMTSDGAFHPKLFLQLGREGAQMIVSSANMTPSGLAGNVELAGALSCVDNDSGEQRLIAKAWRYALRLAAGGGQALAGQVAWTESRTPWLRRATPADGAVMLSDGTRAALLTTGSNIGIAEQYLALVDDAPVRRLIVVSPYWDDGLEALRFLGQRLSPGHIAVLIDRHARSFPKSAYSRVKGLELFDRGTFRKGRFLHAKAIIAQTRNSDHVLYGSANCTVAALGANRFAGKNEEVCLYRRFTAGSLLSALELDDVFGKKGRIDPDDLSPPGKESNLDLAEWRRRTPGHFECQFDMLTWTPPHDLDPDSVTIELLNVRGEQMSCTLLPQAAKTNDKGRFLIGKTSERPAFARLLYRDGRRSPPAIVALVDTIREMAKELRSKPVEDAIIRLSQETEEGLWLLDVLDTLEAAEREQQRGAPPPTTRKRGNRDKASAQEQHRTLSYEAFIAGRRPRVTDSGVVRNSLAGSELSIVRGFMNRILGLAGEDQEKSAAEDEAVAGKAFTLGDETENPDEMMHEAERQGASSRDGAEAADESMEAQQRQTAQRRATRDEMLWAVEEFIERLRERRKRGTLNTFDVLRLRALLMIVAAAGFPGREGHPYGDKPRTSLQVLPAENGGTDWPHALGRILFGFFGGTDPVVRHIRIDAIHDELSDDILESWATCFWAVQACLNAPVAPQTHAKLSKLFLPVAERVYRLTGLTSEELLADNIGSFMGRLGERFALRLGLDRPAVESGHNMMTKKFLKTPELGPGTGRRP